MRVVGGKLRGRRLTPPTDQETRPTSDRIRQAIFNIIESRFRDKLVGGRVADLYAGTGALGIEALSRGAAEATFIERAPDALDILRHNVTTLGLTDTAIIKRGDAAETIATQGSFDIIFMDPPYGGTDAAEALKSITTYKCITPGGVLVIELAKNDVLDIPEPLHTIVEKKYGKTKLLILL